jgi:nickel/cobalt transporter (NicO) family protein
MPDLAQLIQNGSTNLWLFIPSAILLGALHGLEPGHSKTMMAAFIIAVRGTVGQAVMLGLAATVSHTAIVWAIALAGLYFGSQFNVGASEPYLQVLSGALMVAIALWMVWRIWRHQQPPGAHDHHHQGPGDGHDHSHDAPLDAHAQGHADEIARRFTGQSVTTWQIVMFGLTGGLIPCPASITVLLLCLQLKQIALGTLLVLCFSIGLALTMVGAGVAAALSLRHVSKRWPGIDAIAARAPYLSALLIIAVGLYTGYIGWNSLPVA